MAANKKSALNRMIKALTIIIPSMINIAYYIKFLIERELQLFLKNIVVIIILCVLSAILLAGSWFGLLALLHLYLITKMSVVMSLWFLVILNSLLLVLISLYIIKIKSQIFDFFNKYLQHDRK